MFIPKMVWLRKYGNNKSLLTRKGSQQAFVKLQFDGEIVRA